MLLRLRLRPSTDFASGTVWCAYYFFLPRPGLIYLFNLFRITQPSQTVRSFHLGRAWETEPVRRSVLESAMQSGQLQKWSIQVRNSHGLHPLSLVRFRVFLQLTASGQGTQFKTSRFI